MPTVIKILATCRNIRGFPSVSKNSQGKSCLKLPFVGSGITEGLSTSKSSRPHVTVILDFLTGSYFVQCKSFF